MLKVVYKQKLYAKQTKVVQFENVNQITSAKDSNYIASQIWDHDDIDIFETCFAVYLNQANTPIAYAEISKGGITGVIVDNRIVLSHAILAGATGVIIYHNHPSGRTTPSTADIELTIKLKSACSHCDISLLDHVIVTPYFMNFYSFAENGYM